MAAFQLWLSTQRTENNSTKPALTIPEQKFFRDNFSSIISYYKAAHPFTYYRLLDLDKKTNFKNCKQRVVEIKALLTNYPDKFNSDETLKCFLLLLKDALSTLSSEIEKARYDQSIKEYNTLHFPKSIEVCGASYSIERDKENYDFIRRDGIKYYLIYDNQGQMIHLERDEELVFSHFTNP